MKEGLGKAEGASVAYPSAQNPAQDIVAIAVAGQDTIRNREAKSPQVIPDHSEGDVDFLLFVGWLALLG